MGEASSSELDAAPKPTMHAVQVQVPSGVVGGTPFELTYQGRTFRVVCPQGARPGDRITVRLQSAKGAPPIRAPARNIPSPMNRKMFDDNSFEEVSMENFSEDYQGSVTFRGRTRWPFHLFGCCSYTTPDAGKCIWFPVCFPLATCLPSVLYGQNYTLLSGEPMLCKNDFYRRACGCGCGGCVRCWCASLLTFCVQLPFPNPLMCILTLIQRRAIVQYFGISGRFAGASVSLCDLEVCEAICVPCALTQEHELLRLQRLKEEQRPVVRELRAPLPNYETMSR